MNEIKNQGLEGVVAATTRLSSVDGEAGELLIAGFPVEELAPRATFEETTWLLWHGDLPTAEELEAFRRRLAGRRVLPAATLDLLRAAARRRVPVMDALRMAAGTLSLAAGAGGQLLHREAGYQQLAGLAVDAAQASGGGHHSFQSLSLGVVHTPFSFLSDLRSAHIACQS